MNQIPSEYELCEAIADAMRKTLRKLYAEHPGEYYYISLVTTGQGHPPVFAAWSKEALQAAVESSIDPVLALEDLEWSYANSPYLGFGEEYFQEVNRLFSKRTELIGLSSKETNDRLRAMENAVAKLDKEGLFGVGDERLKVVVNAEVMPPDFTNTERAKRLNPAEAISRWLDEVAEE